MIDLLRDGTGIVTKGALDFIKDKMESTNKVEIIFYRNTCSEKKRKTSAVNNGKQIYVKDNYNIEEIDKYIIDYKFDTIDIDELNHIITGKGKNVKFNIDKDYSLSNISYFCNDEKWLSVDIDKHYNEYVSLDFPLVLTLNVSFLKSSIDNLVTNFGGIYD